MHTDCILAPRTLTHRRLHALASAAAFLAVVLTLPLYAHPGPVIAECTDPGTGGDFAGLRGIRFTVDEDFASVVVVMYGTDQTQAAFTAELRRSSGYVGPIEAATRIVTGVSTNPQPIHIDLPTIAVAGSETFTLRFTDLAVTTGALYIRVTGANVPCPNLTVTHQNDVAEPTLRSSAAGLQILGPPQPDCPGGCEGDLNGDRVVNMQDLAIVSENWLNVCPPTELPVLAVTGIGFSEDFAAKLGDALGLGGFNLLMADGSVRFVDEAKFLNVPTIQRGETQGDEDKLPALVEVFDFDAIKPNALDQKAALSKVLAALDDAGFSPSPAIHLTPSIDHTMFSAVDTNGRQVVEVPLDTQVNFEFAVDEVPLIGPGAKMKFAFDGSGTPVLVGLLLPAVQKAQAYPLIEQSQAEQRALQMYRQQGIRFQQNDRVHLRSRVVYYAPSPEVGSIQTIQPHFAVGGRVVHENGGPETLLRVVLVPAFEPQAAEKLLPAVQLFAGFDEPVAYGNVEVSGGNPPYSYSWISSTTDISNQTGSGVQYEIDPRPDLPAPTQETLTVVVTDSSGISVKAEETFELSPIFINALAQRPASQGLVGPLVGGVVDVGTEWIGTSQGLGGSADNANGFVNRFRSAGVPIRFNWGDFNAWERDFKDPVFAGGDDTDWVDNADAVFYTGHANGSGFTFPGNITDDFLHYDDARWGNHDLEWISIAACGPLQLESGGRRWWQRWGPAFRGLHLFNGYQTITFDNTSEGKTYAKYLLEGKTVRHAWMQTGIDIQPATWDPGKSIYTAVMGVFGQDGETNFNDHFWGKGSVGPDIPASEISGYWIIYSPT